MASLLLHTVAPSGGDYTNLDAAIDHLIATHPNLVTSDVYAELKIQGDWSGGADTAGCLVDGLTTDATRYLKIYTDASNRAKASAWDTTRYILSVSNVNAIRIRDDYVWVDGLQITVPAVDGDDDNCLYYASATASANLYKISNCRLVGCGDGTYHQRGIFLDDTDAVGTIWNCIVSGFKGDVNSTGIRLNCNTANVYNCVVYDCYLGVRRTAGTTNIYDSAVFNCTDDFNNTPTVIDYCASDDNDGTNNVAESGGGAGWTGDFTAAATGNFTLISTSALVGAANETGSGTFSDDIDGTVRGASWDVGAHEYVAAGTTAYNVVMNII
jgi:hypothetical protein